MNPAGSVAPRRRCAVPSVGELVGPRPLSDRSAAASSGLMSTTRASCASHGGIGSSASTGSGSSIAPAAGSAGAATTILAGRRAPSRIEWARSVESERAPMSSRRGCLLEIELAGGRLRDPGKHRHSPFGGSAACVHAPALPASQRGVEEHLPRRRSVGDRLSERRRVATNELVRILGPGGKAADSRLDSLGGDDVHRAGRGDPAGVVAVEAQDQGLGDAPEAVDLFPGERGTAAGNGVLHAGGVSGDDVEVALDDHRGVLAYDRCAREIEAEDRRRLVVRGQVGAVQVLRLGVAQGASSESEHVPALVADREYEAIPEPVTGPAAARGVDEPCLDQLVDGGAGLAGHVPGEGVLRGAAGGGEADPELAGKRLPDFAITEQVAPGLAGGGRPQHVLVIRLRLGVELDGSAPAPAGAAGGARTALEFDTGPVGEHLEGLPEVDALDLLDEFEEIPALVTAVAVPDLALRADRERRRLLGVEGTEPRQLPSRTVERDVPADDLDEVQP